MRYLPFQRKEDRNKRAICLKQLTIKNHFHSSLMVASRPHGLPNSDRYYGCVAAHSFPFILRHNQNAICQRERKPPTSIPLHARDSCSSTPAPPAQDNCISQNFASAVQSDHLRSSCKVITALSNFTGVVEFDTGQKFPTFTFRK